MYLPVLNGCANTHYFLQRHYTGYTCLCPHPQILHPHSNAYTCLYRSVCYCSALTHTVHISVYSYTCLYTMAVSTPVVFPTAMLSTSVFCGCAHTHACLHRHSNQSYPPPPTPHFPASMQPGPLTLVTVKW